MELAPFNVIGISIKTTNENGQSGADIAQLWQKFFAEGVLEKIPNTIDPSIYCVYTNYEGDFAKPYTVILGCKTANVNAIPAGMVGKIIPGGTFTQFTAKGDITKGAVLEAWSRIWNSDLDRKYTADFEVYGEKAQNPADAEVDIFIAVK